MTSIIIYLGRQSRVNLVQALFALMKPELLSGKIPVAFFYVESKPDLALNALCFLKNILPFSVYAFFVHSPSFFVVTLVFGGTLK